MRPFDLPLQSTVAMLVAKYVPLQYSNKYDGVTQDEAETAGLTNVYDEKPASTAPRRPSQVSLRCFIAAQCTTVALFVALISTAYVISKSNKSCNVNHSGPAQTARDMKTQYTYHQDRTFASLNTTANDYFMNQTSPHGGEGMVYLQYNGSTESVNWGVSMFHSLHCLRQLRSVIQGTEQKFTKEFNERHNGHCLEYIARNLLCAGDSTIEQPQRQESPDGKHHWYTVDGVGATHQCKDTSLMFEMAERSMTEPLNLGEWQWQPGDTLETVFNVAGKLSKDGSLKSQTR